MRCIHTGHTPSTLVRELEEKAQRERRLAAVLEREGGDIPSVRARIIQHERNADGFEAQLLEERGW